MERRQLQNAGKIGLEEPRVAEFPSTDGKERGCFLQSGVWVVGDAN